MSSPAPQSEWKRRSYPSQTSPWRSSHDASTLSEELEKDPGPLPRSIHAVRDSHSSTHTNGRTIIICLDGTGDKFDSDNSNVVNFVACLKKDDPSQVTYYQSGIGTYDGHGLSNGLSAAIDMAVGSGLGIHVKDAYRFLMQNYREGDKICLFGFSRGSYTVRCLAGMLHKVGLLPAHNGQQVSFAYSFYKNDTAEGWKMSADFKKTFCTDVEVHFVGVYDCVASIGWLKPRVLPFSKSPTGSIRHFRHAMALDEHRAKFKVCQWRHQDPNAGPKRADTIDNTPGGQLRREGGKIRRLVRGSKPKTNETSADDTTYNGENEASHHEKAARESHSHITTDVSEVWFAGAHADVGGGAVPNDERHVLSRIPLRWMIRQCFECNTGIIFSTAPLADTGIDVTTVWPVYKIMKKPACGPSPEMVSQYEEGRLPPLQRRSTALGIDDVLNGKPERNGSANVKSHANGNGTLPKASPQRFDLLPEQVEDQFDAVARINDQLADTRIWWILEIWPVKVRVQKKDTLEWQKVVRMNMGRYRAIRETEPTMHWTVQMRAAEKKYQIRNRVDKMAVWNVTI